jgi:hypothetical protein
MTSGAFGWKPAAAFDLLDLDPDKRMVVETKVKTFNDAIAARAGNVAALRAVREDASSIQGRCAFPQRRRTCRGMRTGRPSRSTVRSQTTGGWILSCAAQPKARGKRFKRS